MNVVERAGLRGISPLWIGPPSNFEFLAKLSQPNTKPKIIASWKQSTGWYCNEELFKEIGLQENIVSFKEKLTDRA